MFGGILITSRGAVACRIKATLRRMRIRAAAIYSEADRHSVHVRQADIAIQVGSYGSIEQVMDAAREAGVQAIHPGDMSVAGELAEACAAQGIVFIGPTPEQLRTFGEKDSAGRIAQTEDYVRLDEPKAGEFRLENGRIAVALTATGGVRSLVHKASGREALAEEGTRRGGQQHHGRHHPRFGPMDSRVPPDLAIRRVRIAGNDRLGSHQVVGEGHAGETGRFRSLGDSDELLGLGERKRLPELHVPVLVGRPWWRIIAVDGQPVKRASQPST